MCRRRGRKAPGTSKRRPPPPSPRPGVSLMSTINGPPPMHPPLLWPRPPPPHSALALQVLATVFRKPFLSHPASAGRVDGRAVHGLPISPRPPQVNIGREPWQPGIPEGTACGPTPPTPPGCIGCGPTPTSAGIVRQGGCFGDWGGAGFIHFSELILGRGGRATQPPQGTQTAAAPPHPVVSGGLVLQVPPWQPTPPPSRHTSLRSGRYITRGTWLKNRPVRECCSGWHRSAPGGSILPLLAPPLRSPPQSTLAPHTGGEHADLPSTVSRTHRYRCDVAGPASGAAHPPMGGGRGCRFGLITPVAGRCHGRFILGSSGGLKGRFRQKAEPIRIVQAESIMRWADAVGWWRGRQS